jgi:hypothetical protein
MAFNTDGVVSSDAALLAALGRTDISVPARIDGRTTDHTETWTICRLLATLANSGKLSYPLSVLHRDRPDFAVTQADATTGIEVTEAVSRQYAAYCALAEREFPEVFLQPAHFRWGAPEMSLKEMRSLLGRSKLTGKAWVGDSAEREWAAYMESVISSKLLKLTKPGYAVFPVMWLAIYDNLPMPNLDLRLALSHLAQLLPPHWASHPSFQTIYIEHGPVVAEIRVAGSNHLSLKDLWQ